MFERGGATRCELGEEAFGHVDQCLLDRRPAPSPRSGLFLAVWPLFRGVAQPDSSDEACLSIALIRGRGPGHGGAPARDGEFDDVDIIVDDVARRDHATYSTPSLLDLLAAPTSSSGVSSPGTRGGHRLRALSRIIPLLIEMAGLLRGLDLLHGGAWRRDPINEVGAVDDVVVFRRGEAADEQRGVGAGVRGVQEASGE